MWLRRIGKNSKGSLVLRVEDTKGTLALVDVSADAEGVLLKVLLKRAAGDTSCQLCATMKAGMRCSNCKRET